MRKTTLGKESKRKGIEMKTQVGEKRGKTNKNQKFWTPTYKEQKKKKERKRRKERNKKANMIKTDLDESIMVKLNNKGKGTSKKLLSEMKRN